MSTTYIVKGDPIQISHIVDLHNKIKGLVVEFEDPNNTETFRRGIPNKESYRIRIEWDGNYLWGYVHKGQINGFVRYGSNDVSKLISIIQYQTEKCLIDEYTYYETEEIFGDSEEEFEEC